jgi:hypothetical protein
MQDVVHGAIRNPVGSSWIHAIHMEADLHVSGDQGNYVQDPLFFAFKSLSHYHQYFCRLSLFQDAVNSCFQGLVPSISESFDFGGTFSD